MLRTSAPLIGALGRMFEGELCAWAATICGVISTLLLAICVTGVRKSDQALLLLVPIVSQISWFLSVLKLELPKDGLIFHGAAVVALGAIVGALVLRRWQRTSKVDPVIRLSILIVTSMVLGSGVYILLPGIPE